MRKSWSSILLAAVIVQIPFELRYDVLSLSNLQWTFLILVTVTVPLLIKHWKLIIRQRTIQAAAVFVTIQWLAALFAPEFHSNAVKAAMRFNAGLLLFMIVTAKEWNDSLDQHHPSSPGEGSFLRRVWIIAASAAALYALLSYLGLGFPSLFRTEEFYIGQVQRLSGSFEYPNTAAAYFAMSLPIVWWSGLPPLVKWGMTFFLWSALVLTFSRGALIAVPFVVTAYVLFTSPRAAKWRPAAALLAIGLASYAILIPVNPYWSEWLYGADVHDPLAAEYKTGWNHLQQQPSRADEIRVQVRNVGIRTWRAHGLWRSTVGYRWWNIASETFLPADSTISTELPHDVGRGETVQVTAPFRTPAEPGMYLLVIELFAGDHDWFSRIGVIPALVKVDVQLGVDRSANEIDVSAFYQRRQLPHVFTVSVPRRDLWKAAVRMILEHPFGMGPDNYRLQYGKYIGATRWDTRVYSNNLFLEILTGSGFLGLAAFVWFLITVPWRFNAESISIGIFLIHGLVDVFLMTTPIYFGFWLLLGNRSERNPV